MQFEELTRGVIGAAIEVHRDLGSGFQETIYRNALLYELSLKGLRVDSELAIQVLYKDRVMGTYRLDLVVEGELILELKATPGITPAHLAQALSYLRATGLNLALVMNFGEPSLSWKRLINSPSNPRHQSPS